MAERAADDANKMEAELAAAAEKAAADKAAFAGDLAAKQAEADQDHNMQEEEFKNFLI